jgi:hypothetical protein
MHYLGSKQEGAQVIAITHLSVRLFFDVDDIHPASVSSVGQLSGIYVSLESIVGSRGSSENRCSSSLRAFNSSGDKDFSLDPNILPSSVCCESTESPWRHQQSKEKYQLMHMKNKTLTHPFPTLVDFQNQGRSRAA